MNKQVKQIVELFLPGYGYKPSGSGHYIITRNGEVHRDEGGRPVVIPSSPAVSERMNILKRLEQVGVIALRSGASVSSGFARSRGKRSRLLAPEYHKPVDQTNNTETAILRNRLKQLGLWRMMQTRNLCLDVSLALSQVSGDTEPVCRQLISRIIDGWSLTPSDREPFDQLCDTLEESDEPMIPALYALVREAKGLTVPAEEVTTVATIDLTKKSLIEVETGKETSSVLEELAYNFISGLEVHKEELQAEMDAINQLQSKVEELITGGSGVHVEAEETPQHVGNGGAATPSQETEEDRETKYKSDQTKTEVLKLMEVGGEWSQRELYEQIGVHQSLMSQVIREMVQEGTVVMVEPGGGPNPARYGSSRFYGRN